MEKQRLFLAILSVSALCGHPILNWWPPVPNVCVTCVNVSCVISVSKTAFLPFFAIFVWFVTRDTLTQVTQTISQA